MILSDIGIAVAMEKGEVKVEPTHASLLQPGSIDIRMGGQVKRQMKTGYAISPSSPPMFDRAWDDVVFTLYPGEFYLANTIETVKLGRGIGAQLQGKSSWGRCGLIVHSTAGWIDPGFEGELTLEMKVIGVDPIMIRKFDPIAQLTFWNMDQAAMIPYGPGRGSKYHGQTGATEVRK